MTSDINILSARRTFFLAVNTGFVTEGIPDHRFLDFYATRSSPELHCSIIGNVVVPRGYGSNAVTPILTENPIWSDIAASIKAGGSVPGIQLATAWEGYVGSRKFRAPEPHAFISEARRLVDHMTADDVGSVLSSFGLATDIAIQHGFRHVQIHAAHGYLLSLLIDFRINRNAAAVLDELASLAERSKRLGIETSIRISLKTGDADFDSSGTMQLQDSVAKLPFDFVDLSSGFYNIDKRLIYPARTEVIEARLQESLAVGARHPARSFIISGHALRHDWTDIGPNFHPGVCRDLIANPRFLQERQNGCRNQNKCHYYSRGGNHLTCGRWKPLPDHS
ncbi:oxidoreductase (plasmid) [Rhizobium leguminosarum]